MLWHGIMTQTVSPTGAYLLIPQFIFHEVIFDVIISIFIGNWMLCDGNNNCHRSYDAWHYSMAWLLELFHEFLCKYW